MNLLYLIFKDRNGILLLSLLSIYVGSFANDSIVDLKFTEYCNSSDAYFLYSSANVSYSKAVDFYLRRVTIESKMVVNNRAGVEKHSFLYLSKYRADKLQSMQIKTLKSDGTVVELDSALVFDYLSDKESGNVNFPIPGVEPGDTVEFSYSYTDVLNYFELGDFVDMYRSIPNYRIEYTVTASPGLLIVFKTYNDFPEPRDLSSNSQVNCVFKMERVRGYDMNQYSCMACELPYAYYSIEKQGKRLRSWLDVYNEEFNYYTQPWFSDLEASMTYKKWKTNLIGKKNEGNKYENFILLHSDIIENTQMMPERNGEMFKPSGYFIKEKRFDPVSIRRLYRQLLEDLEIDYWAVFARSKRAGVIDPFYIRKGEFDHIFFLYEDDQGAFNLLYPHEESYQYQINELPTSLYNTEAIIVKPKFGRKPGKQQKFMDFKFEVLMADSVSVSKIILPGMNSNSNFLRQIIHWDVGLNEKLNPFKSQLTVSGGLSTELRSFYSQLSQDEEIRNFYNALSEFEEEENALSIDTINNTALKPYKPFAYTINAQGKLKNALTKISDSLVSISFNEIIQHKKIEIERDSAELNFYLDYSYSDMFLINLDFIKLQ